MIGLVSVAKMQDIPLGEGERRMTREALIRELRRLARKEDVRFDVVPGRGKGSHYQVYFGDRTTTIKSGELKPGYVKLIRKQLGIE